MRFGKEFIKLTAKQVVRHINDHPEFSESKKPITTRIAIEEIVSYNEAYEGSLVFLKKGRFYVTESPEYIDEFLTILNS